MISKTIALIGNQNCGKTTLFNALTGSNQHVGNFPGVTVEQKSGIIKKHPTIKLVDLPGIYSLTPYTMEEIVSTDFLIKEKPSMIINIIDATSIERNLYLTMQLLELNMPMVLALNMMDEVINSGNCIDVEGLQDALGIRVIPISASKNEGIEELIEAIDVTLNEKNCSHLDLCTGEIHKAIHSINHLIEENALKAALPKRFAVTKVIESDPEIIKLLKLDNQQLHIIGHIIKDMEEKEGLDKDAALVEMRYQIIENITSQTVFKEQETAGQVRSEKIDAFLTLRFLKTYSFSARPNQPFDKFPYCSVTARGLTDIITDRFDLRDRVRRTAFHPTQLHTGDIQHIIADISGVIRATSILGQELLQRSDLIASPLI